MRRSGTPAPGPAEVVSSGPRWPGLTTTQSLAVASQVGVTLALAVGLGLFVGQWVDGQVRTGLLFTLMGVFIGLVSGVSGTVTLYRATLRRSELEWSGDHSKLQPGAPSGSSDPV